jgi:hypothetical protein
VARRRDGGAPKIQELRHLWPAVVARRGEAAPGWPWRLTVVSGLQTRSSSIGGYFGFFFKPIFSAWLLLSVAGMVSLKAGRFASLALLKKVAPSAPVRMAAASLTSGSVVGKEKDRVAIFYFLVRSFLQILGTYIFFLILWDPL